MANSLMMIKNLSLNIDGKVVISNVNLNIGEGEIHLLIGKNGSGKSSLLRSIMFDDLHYEGKIEFQGIEISDLKTFERAKKGIFMAFQEPIEVPGVPIVDFLRQSHNKIHPDSSIDPWTFKDIFDAYADILGLEPDFYSRNVNEGYSGGEKKKMEIIQLLILKPKLALLDEIDSGLDYSSIEKVFEILNDYVEKNNASVLLVSHNKNILDHTSPDQVHIMEKGTIMNSGNKDLLEQL